MFSNILENFSETLKQRLIQQKKNNLFRKRRMLDARHGIKVTTQKQELINFSSNDYLGLSNHPQIISAFKKAADQFGVGSSASPMISGRSYLHHKLEEKLAEKTGQAAALTFSCGYMANLALVTTLVSRTDGVFLDRLAHASLIDAAQLSMAKLHRYKHADPDSLNEVLIKSTTQKKLVLTDTIFSMDGDIAPLNALIETCNKNQAVLAVDDAHGFGVLGETGGGLLELEQQQNKAAEKPILVATFGKALGTAGAFIASEKTIIEALRQFARSYIYSTAQPPALVSATLVALTIIEKESWRREKLTHLIKHFRRGCSDLGLALLPSETAIQPLIIGDSEKALQMSQKLKQHGFLIPAIRPPTVPKNSARLRISLSATHTEDQIDKLLEALSYS